MRDAEALAALKGVGIVPDDELPPGEVGWTVTLDPHGETPVESAEEALSRLLAASWNDGSRAERADMLEVVQDALKKHWLTDVECHHANRTDTAHCFCTIWCSEPMPSVGQAVEAWIAHVMHVIKQELT